MSSILLPNPSRTVLIISCLSIEFAIEDVAFGCARTDDFLVLKNIPYNLGNDAKVTLYPRSQIF